MTTQEMIDVLKAYQEGKEIEFKYITSDDSDWIVTTKPSFNFNMYEYRVKPEYELRRFKLIEEFPLSPSLGTIVEFKTQQHFNEGIYDIGAIPNLILRDCTNYPKFWEEIIEEKIYTHEDDLVGRKCYFKGDLHTITYSDEKQIVINNYFNISREYFNEQYKLI